jgi:cytosine/adenosine deaminase-related metal-dependent hydrolase
VQRYDLILAGGRVVDPGTATDAISDVGVAGGKISAVAGSLEPAGSPVVDVTGLVVTAGFIDLHSHCDSVAGLRLQALDGVTTALELEAGVLPVQTAYARAAAEGRPVHYGFSASWAQARMAVLAGHPPDGSLAGFLRHIGDPAWQRQADAAATERIRAALLAELGDGALGIGILAAYAPHLDPAEYLAVAGLAAEAGVPAFTHVRDLAEFGPAAGTDGATELVQAALATGAPMHFCHIHASCRTHLGRVLDMIAAARGDGARITTEAYPYGIGMTGIGAAFLDPAILARRGLQPGSIRLAATGERVQSLAHLEALRAADGSALAFVENLHEDDPGEFGMLVDALLFADGAIASDAMPLTWHGPPPDPLAWPVPPHGVTHPRTAGTFSRAIRLLHRERGADLAGVLRRCSLLPAQILAGSVPAMRRKGRLGAGCDADITVFSPAAICDRSTYAATTQAAAGIEHVLVGGTFVVRDGQLAQDALPGRPVRR